MNTQQMRKRRFLKGSKRNQPNIERLENRRLLAVVAGPTSLRIGNTLFFAGTSAADGTELWKSNADGSNKTLVKDIAPGAKSSAPDWLVNFGGTLYFAATTTANGRELWKSDGTAAGTVLVADVESGAVSSTPYDLTVANNHLFFVTGFDPRLCAYDSTDGVVQVFKPGTSSDYNWAPDDWKPIATGDRFYFQVSNSTLDQIERWQSDGTVASTRIASPLGLIDSAGVLSIFGTNSNDSIQLSTSGASTSVNINGTIQHVDNGGFDSIQVNGLAGDDTITLAANVAAPATLMGDGGADSIVGGSGNDVIYGSNLMRPIDSSNTIDGGAGADLIYGGVSRNVINGGTGNDTLDGRYDDADSFMGDAGDDTFIPSGNRNNSFDGGSDTDTLDVSGLSPVIGGGGLISFYYYSSYTTSISYTGADRLICGSGADAITLADDDSIRFIDAGKGNDTLIGAAQGETLIGGDGADSILGNGGNDLLVGGSGSDTVNGGAGQDTIVAGSEAGDSIISDADDVLDASPARIVDGYLNVVGTTGDDRINIGFKPGDASTIRVTINGSFYQFPISQMSGVSVGGGAGNDAIVVSQGIPLASTLRGDEGSDTLTGGGGDDVLDGGDGSDTADFSAYTVPLTAAVTTVNSSSGGKDTYTGMETLLCGSGDDSVSIFNYNSGNNIRLVDGGPGNDSLSLSDATLDPIAPTVHGGDGNDTLSVDRNGSSSFSNPDAALPTFYFGDAGDDTLNMFRSFARRDYNGGSGIDSVNYGGFSTAGGLLITLDDRPGDGPHGLDNVHSDIEIVYGSPWNDTIIGNDHNETLIGGSGSDSLVGNGGDDDLVGYSHGYPGTNDALISGPGHDTLEGGTRLLSEFDSNDVLIDMDPVASVNHGELQVTGTAGNDVIKFQLKDGDANTIQAVVNGQVFEFDASTISKLKAVGSFGSDSISVDPAITLPATLLGGATNPGQAGNDTLIGGSGNDLIEGGDGNDSLSGGAGNDTIDGNGGTDTIDGGPGLDTINGVQDQTNDPAPPEPTPQQQPTQPQPAPFSLNGGVLTLTGTGAADAISVKPRKGAATILIATINGLSHRFAAADVKSIVINALGGNDTVRLDSVSIASKVNAGAGDDTIYGSAAADRINGGDGNDWISSGAGNDTLYGEAGNDRLFGGDGKDLLNAGLGSNLLRGGDGWDRLSFNKSRDDARGNKGDSILSDVLD